MPKLFLSYNRQNQAFVAAIAQFLYDNGFKERIDIFFDEDNLNPGDNWMNEIENAIINSEVCLVFIGKQGIGRWQNKEIIKAIDISITSKENYIIIPVIIPLENGELTKNLPWFLADYQWVQFSGVSDQFALEKLINGIRKKEAVIVRSEKNPFKGLENFEVEDAPYYCGRTFDLNWIFYKKLGLNSKEFTKNFLAMIGDSGSGKSSFARAGILAALKNGKYKDSETWIQIIIKPGDRPLLNLSAALEKNGIINNSYEFEQEALKVKDTLRRKIQVFDKKLVLLVDQFEEILTQCKDENERVAFLDNMIEALKSGKFLVLLTLRSDFYTSFTSYKDFEDKMICDNYILPVLDFSKNSEQWYKQISDLIQIPALLNGVTIDKSFIEKVSENLKDTSGVLPVLQLTMKILWENTKGKSNIGSSDLDFISNGKGIEGIIEQHAEDVYNYFTEFEKNDSRTKLLKDIFIRMVELTENKEDVRKTVKQDELINDLKSKYNEDQIKNTINFLAGEQSRLLRIRKESNDTLVEVVHEVLIRKWDRFRNWINEKREAILYKENILRDIKEYENEKKNKEQLYKGSRLKKAQKWLIENEDLKNEKIEDFINLSRKSASRRITISIIIPILILAMIPIIINLKKDWDFKDSAIARSFTNRNIPIDEVRKLEIGREADLKFLYGFKNLDSLIIQLTQIKDKDDIKEYFEMDELENLSFLSVGFVFNFENLSGLEKFVNLKSLSLNKLSKLQNLSGIDKLINLGSLTLTDLDKLQNLSGIDKLKNLKILNLAKLGKLQNLSGIEELTNLKSLAITKLDSLQNLSGVEKLTNLKSLTISQIDTLNRYSNSDWDMVSVTQSIAEIQYLTNLNSLTLIGIDNLQNLTGIEKLTNLSSLTLKLIDSLKELTGLEKLTNLDSLILEDLPNLSNLSEIENLTNLNSLTLTALFDLPNLEGIQKLTNLNSLTLIGLFDLPNLSGIEKLTNLNSLTLTSFDDWQNLNGIENLTNLNSLTLSSLYHFPNLTGIEKLTNLKSLTLNRLDNLQNLTGIEKLTNLKFLALSNLDSLQSLEEIKKLTSLESLQLSELKCFQSLTDLEQLSDLNSLILINLDSLQSLNGIEKLSNLTSLSLRLFDLQKLNSLEKLHKLSVLLVDSERLSKNLSNYDLKNISEIFVPKSFSITSVTDLEILAKKFPKAKILYIPQ